jgi:hypothetical protein
MRKESPVPLAPRLVLPLAACAALPLALTAGRAFAPNSPGPLGALAREARRGASVEARQRDAWRSIAAKRKVAWDLIEGRMTLREALEDFRAWEGRDGLPPGSAARTDEELCRRVLGWVEEELYGQPARAAAVLDALEAEWRRTSPTAAEPG